MLTGQMVTIRKILIVLLLVIFFTSLVTISFFHLYYSSHLSGAPNIETGRIYRMSVNHGFIVYGTKQEFDRLSVAEKWFPFACICGVGAGLLNAVYGVFPPTKSKYPRKWQRGRGDDYSPRYDCDQYATAATRKATSGALQG